MIASIMLPFFVTCILMRYLLRVFLRVICYVYSYACFTIVLISLFCFFVKHPNT